MIFLFKFFRIPIVTPYFKTISWLLLILVFACGCSSRTRYLIGEPGYGPPVKPSDIVIVEKPDIKNYQIVGRVHAHTKAPKWLPWLLKSHDELLENLKREAALLHAEAIIDIKRYSRSQFEWQEEHLMGTATIIRGKEASDEP